MKKIVLSLALVAMLSLVGCAAKTSETPATEAPAAETTTVVPETTVTPDAEAPVAPVAETPAK